LGANKSWLFHRNFIYFSFFTVIVHHKTVKKNQKTRVFLEKRFSQSEAPSLEAFCFLFVLFSKKPEDVPQRNGNTKMLYVSAP
jgi:hypothetical protein